MALPPCRYLTLAVALALGAVPAVWTAAAEGAESEQGEAGAGEPAGPTIYKWIDEHGIAHYTTDFERTRTFGSGRDRSVRRTRP
jgi:hypothetical protein